MPYIAPLYGGVEAEMLSILRDPGPMTNAALDGSGFLCLEDDDPAAELFATLLAEAGIAPSRMTPWNAYPWYINRKPNTAELTAGHDPLRRLLGLLPRLRVVMLNGGDGVRGRSSADHGVVSRAPDLSHGATSVRRHQGCSRGADGRSTSEVRDGGRATQRLQVSYRASLLERSSRAKAEQATERLPRAASLKASEPDMRTSVRDVRGRATPAL